MSIELIIYLVGLLDNLAFWCVLSMVCAIFGGLLWVMSHFDYAVPDNAKRILKKITISSMVFLTIFTFIPNQKTAYLMLGAHFGKEVIQSETASKVQRIIDGKLDEYLKELEK